MQRTEAPCCCSRLVRPTCILRVQSSSSSPPAAATSFSSSSSTAGASVALAWAFSVTSVPFSPASATSSSSSSSSSGPSGSPSSSTSSSSPFSAGASTSSSSAGAVLAFFAGGALPALQGVSNRSTASGGSDVRKRRRTFVGLFFLYLRVSILLLLLLFTIVVILFIFVAYIPSKKYGLGLGLDWQSQQNKAHAPALTSLGKHDRAPRSPTYTIAPTIPFPRMAGACEQPSSTGAPRGTRLKRDMGKSQAIQHIAKGVATPAWSSPRDSRATRAVAGWAHAVVCRAISKLRAYRATKHKAHRGCDPRGRKQARLRRAFAEG